MEFTAVYIMEAKFGMSRPISLKNLLAYWRKETFKEVVSQKQVYVDY